MPTAKYLVKWTLVYNQDSEIMENFNKHIRTGNETLTFCLISYFLLLNCSFQMRKILLRENEIIMKSFSK